MDSLTISQVIVDSGLLILIWLVQLIIYPSFRYTADEDFISWHTRYTGLIALVVTPLMLLQAGIEIMHFFFLTPRWLRIFLISAIWISTFTLSVPCHSRLHNQGKTSDLVQRLIATNWVRTVLWSIVFLETAIYAYK